MTIVESDNWIVNESRLLSEARLRAVKVLLDDVDCVILEQRRCRGA